MTLVEFLHPLRDGSLRDVCLAVLYFESRYANRAAISVEDLRALFVRAKFPRAAKLNFADILAKSAPYVDVAGKEGKRFLWQLTATGEKRVRTLLKLPDAEVELEHDVSTLEGLVAKVTEPDVADYVKESVKCLSVGALRAATVFLWTGAVRDIQQRIVAEDNKAVNAAVQKYDKNCPAISRIDDLSYLKESKLLLVAQELGLFDKNERAILDDALDLRNKCGHPGNYKPGPKKVSSFVEDVVGIVFA